jgi:hypothetical protein
MRRARRTSPRTGQEICENQGDKSRYHGQPCGLVLPLVGTLMSARLNGCPQHQNALKRGGFLGEKGNLGRSLGEWQTHHTIFPLNNARGDQIKWPVVTLTNMLY